MRPRHDDPRTDAARLPMARHPTAGLLMTSTGSFTTSLPVTERALPLRPATGINPLTALSSPRHSMLSAILQPGSLRWRTPRLPSTRTNPALSQGLLPIHGIQHPYPY